MSSLTISSILKGVGCGVARIMPKKAKELSALSVAKIKETGRHAVGGVDGLFLNVKGNSRVWILRAVVGKRLDINGNLIPHRRDIGLGPYPEVNRTGFVGESIF